MRVPRSPAPRTHRRCPRSGLLVALAALAAFAMPPSPLAAQETGVVAGVISSGVSPVAQAQVVVIGTTLGAQTDAEGRFRITGVTGQQVTLEVRRLGFRPARENVRVGDTNILIALQPSATSLEAVVITGTAGATERRAIGNAVSTIQASDVTDVGTVNTVQQLINGRATGVVVQPATGNVGGGSRIRIRGAASFSLSNEPLIYVDGVRVNNASATGPANQAFGSSSISRLNDFNPDEIESIEIIKGPAAATLYGTEASNGVIQIITKRGASGAPRWTVSTKQGGNYFRDPEGRLWTNWQTNAAGNDTIPIDIVELEDAAGRPIFRTGWHQEYDLSLSGGADRISYFAGGGLEHIEGIERSNTVKRASSRLNLNVRPTDKWRLDFNLGYVSGDVNMGAEAGFGGRVWTSVLADARKLGTPRRGFHSGLPEEYDQLYHFNQGLGRLTGSFNINHAPSAWFTHQLNLGLDRTNESNQIFFPRIDSLTPTFGSEALGYKEVNERTVDFRTATYNATATFDVTPTFRSATSVGGQYYGNLADSVFSSGSIFPAPGLSSIAATTGPRVTSEDFREDATVGFYVQEQVSWRDRLFLTAAVRMDDNSAFGENFDRVLYPKFSASWIASEEGFWPFDFVNTLKIRAAYGESGKQPQTFASLRTYQAATGAGDLPAVTPQFIGNPDLGPEVGKELELGFDATMFQDRLGLEFTYFNKRTEDAILEREIPPSAGYPGFQFFNAGEIANSGFELLARGRPVDGPKLAWDITASMSTTSNEVKSLGDPDLKWVVAPGGFLRHQVGRPVGAFFEQDVLSAERNAQGQVTNVQCADGNGGAMLCAGTDGRYGTADDAPDVYLGWSVPKVEWSLMNTLTFFRDFRVYAMLDAKQGHKKIDGNTRVRCAFFGGRCRENFFPAEFSAQRIAEINSGNNLVDWLIQDASFVRLREVAFSYTVPARWTSRLRARSMMISVAGRNLATWTDYPGLEPEAMFLGGSRGGNHGAWEQTVVPQLSQWLVTLNLGF